MGLTSRLRGLDRSVDWIKSRRYHSIHLLLVRKPSAGCAQITQIETELNVLHRGQDRIALPQFRDEDASVKRMGGREWQTTRHRPEPAQESGHRVGVVERVFVDQGYRGHGSDGPEQVHVDRRRRGNIQRRLCRLMKRRAAIEPVIGHMKSERRLERNRLKWGLGDNVNAILSAAP